jgi:hypothetical protein
MWDVLSKLSVGSWYIMSIQSKPELGTNSFGKTTKYDFVQRLGINGTHEQGCDQGDFFWTYAFILTKSLEKENPPFNNKFHKMRQHKSWKTNILTLADEF